MTWHNRGELCNCQRKRPKETALCSAGEVWTRVLRHQCTFDDRMASDILHSVRVDVAAYSRAGRSPTHLAAVVACVRSWRSVAEIQSLHLTIHTNDAPVVNALLEPYELTKKLPPNWRLSVAPWTKRAKKPYMLAHAHLREWARIVADELSPGTAFIQYACSRTLDFYPMRLSLSHSSCPTRQPGGRRLPKR